MNHPRIAPLVVAALVTVTMTACSSGVSGQPSDGGTPVADGITTEPAEEPPATVDVTAIDPCELVTKEEASAIIQLEVGEPQRGNPGRPSCTYGAPPEGPVGKVDIYVGEGAENVMNLDRDVLKHEFTEIDIGDEAYTKDHQIFFRKGEVWVFIGAVRIVDPEQTRGPIDEAARRAVSRM